MKKNKNLEEKKQYSDLIIKFLSLDINKYIKRVIDGLKIVADNLKINSKNKAYFEGKAKEWSKYGVGFLFNAPVKIFLETPKDESFINDLLKKYSTGEELIKIFDKIRSIKYLNSLDIEEMIFLYENKKYKSCIMLLFSFIDCVIINLQDIGIKGRKLPNKVRDIDLTKIANEYSFTYLEYCIITQIIEEVYGNAKDFVSETMFDLPNRNFIQHGMSNRVINMYDCLKMMHLLINAYDYFSISIDSKNRVVKKKLVW